MPSLPQGTPAHSAPSVTLGPAISIGSPISNVTRTSFLAECSEAMKWIQDRSVVLGIFALATTTWLWIDFSVIYDIGTGIFSGSVLGALPSLLIFAALLGLVLTLILLMPALLLLVDLNVKRPRLVDLDRRIRRIRVSLKRKDEPHDAKIEAAKSPIARRRSPVDVPLRSFVRWGVISGLQALIVALAIFLPVLLNLSKEDEHLFMGVCVGAAVIVPSMAFRIWIPGKVSFEFGCLIVGSVLVQVQLALISVLSTSAWVLADDPDLTWANSATCTLVCIGASVFLGVFQVVLIGLFQLLVTGKNVVLRSLMVGQLLLVVCAAIAPLGAGLIYAPVRIMGMNGMACAVLPIVTTERDKLPLSLLDGTSAETAELSFITPVIDDVRYVRLKKAEHKTTIAVAKGTVGQPRACPSAEEPAKKTSAP